MIEKEEYDYLNNVLDELNNAIKQATSGVEKQDSNYKELQKYMIDYKAELDKFEVYDYQRNLNMIDKQGYAQVLERERLKRLYESPYFGRIDFLFDGDDLEFAENVYIGKFSFKSEEGDHLVYDWRAPICNMYYEYEKGAAQYVVNHSTFSGEILKKKQYKIEKSQLIYALDSSVTIQDEILQQTLNNSSSDKMKTIITSIQKEQNRIVRNESAQNVVIQGVAGSGKTAVALHRIAYLLYKFRDTLESNRIFILSPNKVFGDYISTVLPELGEEPIKSVTLDELTRQLLPNSINFRSFELEMKEILNNPYGKLAKRAAMKANYEFVEKITSFLINLNNEILKKESISIASHEIDSDYIQARFKAYSTEPVSTRLELVADDIIQMLKAKFKNDIKLPSKNEVIKRLKKRLNFDTTLDIYKHFSSGIGSEYFQMEKNELEFNDVFAYLYCQNYFEGMKKFDLIQHFVLDEMQDYTPIQYAVFSQIFKCKKTIIGDFSQALLPFETITKYAYEQIFNSLEYVELTTTYRSSYEIANYAKKFMRTATINPIERHGTEPEELSYSTRDEMNQLLMDHLKGNWKTTAIICKSEEDVKKISSYLEGINQKFYVLDGDTVFFETGLILTTIQYAKGLEFDSVILPFVTNDKYATEFDKGLLYIATTRAMHELTVLVDKNNPSVLI